MSQLLVTIETGEPVRLLPISKVPILVVGDDQFMVSAPSMAAMREFLRAALTAVDGDEAVACAMSDLAVLRDAEEERQWEEVAS